MEFADALKFVFDDQISKQLNPEWADLGCGSGLFTYALANIIPAGGTIYAVDKSKPHLTSRSNPHNILIRQNQLDFVKDQPVFSNLDGILMANSLHFAEQMLELIIKLGKCIKTDGSFLIIEYDTDTPNRWVPFPVSYVSLEKLFKMASYPRIRKLYQQPSAFRSAFIYSAIISR